MQTYLIPQSVAEALDCLAGGAVVIAGGTDLMVARRHGRGPAGPLLDISRLPELAAIQQEDGWLSLGAACTHARLAEALRETAPALAEACGQVGSPLIRNLGTLGGNLVNASPAADSVTALAALGAVVEIAGPGGTRRVAAEELAVGPGQTCLAPGELVTRVLLPLPAAGEGQSFLKLGRRRALSISVVNAAARVVVEGRKIRAARLALGAVAPRVLVSRIVGEMLQDREPDERLLRQVVEAARGEVSPISDLRASAAYRREMAGVFARRAVELAYRRALGEAI